MATKKRVEEQATVTPLEELDELDGDDLDGDETDIDLQPTIYYLNKKITKSDLPTRVIHWSAIQPKMLHHTGDQLATIRDDRKILSPLYDVRFYCLSATEAKVYYEIKVDKDFVLWKLANLLNAYADTDKEKQELVRESDRVSESIREKQLENDLEALARKFGLSKEDVLAKLAK